MSSVLPSAQAAFLNIFDNMIERPLGPNLVWIFALEMRRYMETYGTPKEHIASVSIKNKANAMDHPSAMLGKKFTLEEVMNSEVLCEPVHLLDISPVADGAVSFVKCFNSMNHYVKLPDTGIINTFSLAVIRTDATRRDKAEIPIVVDIDNTTLTPSRFLHLLDEDFPHDN